MDDFAVFILTHGRPDNVKTYKTLRKQGYTGKIYIIIDDQDDSAPRYYENYGDMVIMFDKEAVASRTDSYTNSGIRNGVLFARNACFEIARQLGITYFLELDDDYKQFHTRFNENLEHISNLLLNDLNKVFEITLDYYKSIPALTIAYGQSGDFIGGGKGLLLNELRLRRKAMNSFFCSVDRPFDFLGILNEDVNAYCTLGHRGALIFSIFNVSITQTPSQTQVGGITELYKSVGTYVKSFYTVMACPSFVTVEMMRSSNSRIHHKIKWENAVPKIVSETIRKHDSNNS